MGPHDDLWSLFYILIHFATGTLPWADVTDKETAGKIKADCDHAKLCDAMMAKKSMIKVLDHLNTLDYSSRPDYALIRDLISQIK